MSNKRDTATLTILRSDPTNYTEPHYETYSVKAAKDTTVLDALFPVSYTHLTLPTILRV